jgi:hypothetical protein
MQLTRKFPSFDTLIQGAFSAFKRFPLALLSAVITSLALVFLVGVDNGNAPHWLGKLAMAAGLGVPLFIALVTWAEQKGLDRKLIAGVQALGAILVLCYYISLPQDPSVNYSFIVRFLLLQVTLHFLVAFLPYIGGNQVAGFWQYNKSLFLRFLNSALFSAVMYIGLLLALIAAKELFGFNIPEKRFFQLFLVIAIVFNTWIFLSGIPQNFRELNSTTQYPNGLRIFVQYILLPLIGLYFVILYAYELKIIFTWNWPKGWVSQLVLWFSVSGILSLLLLWPLRNMTENRWIRTFIKWFFRALIPLVVMLFLAISERIGAYGITVNRFLVLAMSIGLTILVLYFVFGRAKDIRIIPIIVCLIALLSAYGPWSAFSIAKFSQKNRLESYLKKTGLLENGALKAAISPLSHEDRSEMSQIVRYLSQWHGLDSFSPWISDSTLSAIKTTASEYQIPDSIAKALGFEYTYSPVSSFDNGVYFDASLDEKTGVKLDGYDWLFVFGEGYKRTFFLDGHDTLYAWIDSGQTDIKLLLAPDSIAGKISLGDSIRASVETMNNDLMSCDHLNYATDIGPYSILCKAKRINGRLETNSINYYDIKYYSADVYLLVRKNAP